MKLPCFAILLLASTVLADDKLRDAQAELKSQGFYYGEVNGTESAETTAALRRYQIRNGLAVTGKLDDPTLAALGMEPEKPAATAKTNPPAPPKKAPQLNPPAPGAVEIETPRPTARPRQDLLRGEEGVAPANPAPGDPAVVDPPTRIPSAVDNAEYATFFHGTPYAKAPLEVQFDIVRKAQTKLSRAGYYKGAVNGLPATLTSEALFLYQDKQRLPRTGRLDLQTLADLSLLPGRGEDAPPIRPFTNPNRGRDRSIDYRGFVR